MDEKKFQKYMSGQLTESELMEDETPIDENSDFEEVIDDLLEGDESDEESEEEEVAEVDADGEETAGVESKKDKDGKAGEESPSKPGDANTIKKAESDKVADKV